MHFGDAKHHFVVHKRKKNAKPCPEKSDFKCQCYNSVMFEGWKLTMRQHMQYNLLFHNSPYTQAARRVVSCLILHTVFFFFFFNIVSSAVLSRISFIVHDSLKIAFKSLCQKMFMKGTIYCPLAIKILRTVISGNWMLCCGKHAARTLCFSRYYLSSISL